MSDQETLYARWLDGDLDAEEIKSLKASGEWEELERLVKATNKLKLPAYNKETEFEKLINNRKSKTGKEQPEENSIKLSTVISAAASLLLLIAAIIFLREAAPVASANNGETLVHNFSDGSEVLLNDGSSVAYNIEGWESNREVSLKGEALFDVKKGSRFLVETDNGIVEVLGTSFNVRSWGDHFSVECYHGKVMVKSRSDSTVLTALQAVIYKEGMLRPVEEISHQKPPWTSNSSKFKNEKIDNVFAELERQYDISVDRPNFNKRFTGSFTHTDLNTALQQITKPMGLKYNTHQQGMRVIITK